MAQISVVEKLDDFRTGACMMGFMNRLSSHYPLLASLLAGALLGACSEDNAGHDADTSRPEDSSQEAIEGFLESEAYRNDPWIGDANIRGSDSSVNVHGDHLRVFFNPEAVVGKGDGSVSPQGAMIIKEIYDSDGSLLGQAVQLKHGTESGREDWTFYCTMPEGSSLCTGGSDELPIYGEGIAECGFCHADVPYAPLPE